MTQTARPAPAIYALTIERFRGITSLKWKRSRGVNVIIGGSDVGKTTILEVITLLLSVWKDSGFTNPEDYFVRILPIRARQPLGRCRTGPSPPVEAAA
jgi:putative ATP-dependent endonuclease of OLD family